MKKIGVVTIYDSKGNIGNKLQNYAVIKVYNSLGCSCSTLATEKEISFRHIIYSEIKSILQKYVLHKTLFNPYNHERIMNYRKFNRNLNVDYSLINGKKTNYDIYSVGSDQVWNVEYYKYNPNRKNYYLLNFVKDKKKIAYSPSFGISELPEDWQSWFKSNLSTFKALSVREYSGMKIIYELIEKKADVLIDPTLMLDKEEWIKEARKPKNLNVEKPYVLTYFLGERNDEITLKCDNLANEIEGVCYHLFDPNNKALSNAGPAEFLMLVKNASIILTDSFHACVFSFIFNKPFIVFQREGNVNMFSRIETFLSTFNLERKYIDSGLENNIWEHDYTEGYKKLKIEREKALDFLKKAIEE